MKNPCLYFIVIPGVKTTKRPEERRAVPGNICGHIWLMTRAMQIAGIQARLGAYRQ
jgi:hypothetical protein